tara:strand:- start:2491 stop:3924 length:1434 start_codon:yes stop_codon:yes gene_type:complete
MAKYRRVIHWFRRDLRLTDNTALSRAVAVSDEVIPLYVVSDWKGDHAWTGAGRQQFLAGCLKSLAANVEHSGGRLIFRRGQADEVIDTLISESGADALFFNRDPDPFGKSMEEKLAKVCQKHGIDCVGSKDAVLHEAGEALTGSGGPYKVFTPYSRKWFGLEKEEPVGVVSELRTPDEVIGDGIPSAEVWGQKFEGALLREPGERAARIRLKNAIGGAIGEYSENRNDPFADATSHLGADLRYGTLSVREVFHAAEKAREDARSGIVRESIGNFQRQLAWREFFIAILSHYPEVLKYEFNPVWRGLEWDDPDDGDRLQKWKEGRTGFPIVDAGMRQLSATGFMHNRVRMITAMFLTKDLHVDWRHGEQHFMQYLLDGEIACNNGGWQWSAGTGADAAPYFRIQNPWSQTKRYDPEGRYIKRWLPELEKVEPRRFYQPPPPDERLSPDYPLPMADHGEERLNTLERFKRHRSAVVATK